MLAALILDALRNTVPLRARNLVARIREQFDKDDVTLHEVNSVLYRELSGSVIQNGSHEWAIKPFSAAPARPLVVTLGENDQRAAHLRAIQRLRSGLPPDELIEELTIGDHRDAMHAIIVAQQCRWLLVVGDYGHGKSHALSIFDSVAQHRSYATCHLAADAAASALNHPQRFLPVLLGTLEFPGRGIRGYQDLLYDILDDQAVIDNIRSCVTQRLSETTLLRRDLDNRLSALQCTDHTDFAEYLIHKQAVTSLLIGDSISTRFADPSARSQAYELLGIAQDIVVANGGRGLAFIIDEAESIYTKLPRSLSRYGAFRALSSLCMSDHFVHCCAAIGVTPDAYRELRQIDIAAARYGCLPTEPLEAWARAIHEERVPLIMCAPFSIQDKIEILSRVEGLYRRAYPAFSWSDHLLTEWRAFQQATAIAPVPIRIAVRRAVDYLDIQRCSPCTTPSGE